MAKDKGLKYQVVYRGGLAELPKAKVAAIDFLVTDDSFLLSPTRAAAKFWTELSIPFSSVSSVEIVARQVSTAEALLGGLDSRQLNQDNNIQISFTDEQGKNLVLRLEMLSGITVMGQAKKAREFQDQLRALGIQDKFKSTVGQPASNSSSADELAKFAELYRQGILTEEEFAAKKAQLLG